MAVLALLVITPFVIMVSLTGLTYTAARTVLQGHAMAAGVCFGAGYPAILIFHLAHGSAMVLDVVFTALYFLVVRFMIRCFTQKDVFYGFVVYLMLYNAYADSFVQGEYASVRAQFIIMLALLFFVVVPAQEVIRHHRAQVRLRAQTA